MAPVKVAVMERASVIDTTHDPVPVHAPDHPANDEPRPGLAVNVTDVPEAYASEQSVPQVIPAGVLRTVPEPTVDTVRVNVPPVEAVKVAVTDRASVIDTTHDPVPVHAPDHPAKDEPRPGLAVNVTDVPDPYASEQSVPQVIPAGVLRTVPDPTVVTVRVNVPPVEAVKVAVTDRAWVIDTTHEPVPVHAPDHPANVEPAAGAAVNVTDVPDPYASEQSLPQSIPTGELVTIPDPVPDFTTDSVNVAGVVPPGVRRTAR